MSVSWFEQSEYSCRLEWGRRGAEAAARRGDIVVVVDTLSFSTCAITALAYDGIIYPCATDEDPQAFANRVDAQVAVHRTQASSSHPFSLSPLTYIDMKPNTKVVLSSLNGATCSRLAHQVPYVIVGALLNAKAVGEAVSTWVSETNHAVTVLACGERWTEPHEDGPLRFAVEDYLGAGAILSQMSLDKSPEAQVCQAAFESVEQQIEYIIWACGGAIELRERGFEGDVIHAAKFNLFDVVPLLKDGKFISWNQSE